MRRLLALVAVFTVTMPVSALATELDELLSRSQEASYTAEQAISCLTPDGVRDAIVRITQNGRDITLSSTVSDDIEIAAGSGNWSLRQGGGLVAESKVAPAGDNGETGLYSVGEEVSIDFLGRSAVAVELVRDGESRARLVFDDETGAMVEAVTFGAGGDVYCERRFISFETEITADTLAELATEEPSGTMPSAVEDSSFPTEVAGFVRLDQYEDEDGVRFAYYSDGFFSFALFDTPAPVALPESTVVELDSGVYARLFTAGQVTYAWETENASMAMVGDLPPDLHSAVLDSMPHPHDPGLLRRWWRNIFG